MHLPVTSCDALLLCCILRMQRRQQGAAFTPEAMDAYLPRVVAICEEYLAQWAAQERVSLVPAVRVLCLRAACGFFISRVRVSPKHC